MGTVGVPFLANVRQIFQIFKTVQAKSHPLATLMYVPAFLRLRFANKV